MIRLKHLLREITDIDLKRCLMKIKNNEFKLVGAGDNGRVYEIDDEDKVFKITKERDEYKVAARIVDKYDAYSTFIPVYYVNGSDMFIMANAAPLPGTLKQEIDAFMQEYGTFAREQGGEVSIFEFTAQTDSVNKQLNNFLNALQQDVEKLAIPEFELDLDFRSDNVMIWNRKLVLVDW
jgi:hypothetical protein